MPIPLAGPGQGLPFPQNYYPTELQNAPQDASGNRLGLAPGDVFVIPAGDWIIGLGMYCVLQFLDPVTNVWVTVSGAAWTRGQVFVSSDGFTQRVANLTGCVVSAAVIVGGTNYVQATTTITAIGGFSPNAVPTLLPIVGGALGLTGTFTVDVPTKGAGYGVAPIIMIPPPPPAQTNANGVGGIPAVAVCTIGTGGSISSVSIINPGAGYPTAPIAVVVPSPFDPNLSVGITAASVAFSLTSSGVIMGALVTNNGGPLPNGSLGSVTLSIGGAGSSGSLTANVMQTIVSGTLSSAGTGYGTGGVGFVTYGGAPLQGSITNGPDSLFLSFEPRPANLAVTAASVSLAAPATIYDGGLFESAPTIAPLNPSVGGAAPTTVAGLTAVMGSRYDFVVIQPGP
jgi:hypothetical protein